jgi:hypothetical protein
LGKDIAKVDELAVADADDDDQTSLGSYSTV